MQYINDLNLSEIAAFLRAAGEKPFRAKQIYAWLWQKNVASFQEMSNLSVSLRNLLSSHYHLRHLSISKEHISSDGSRKYVLRLFDGEHIEMVLIPSKQRTTVCISSQVGCMLRCKFCATGAMGFRRNLFPDEIYQQVFLANQLSLQYYATQLSNIVFMGMGEPLLNLDNVHAAIEKITHQEGLGMSPTRITVSSAGIPQGIRLLAKLQPHINLALSLHAADNHTRKAIMPIAQSYSLQEIIEALKDYHQITHQRITIEYLLLNNVNDSLEAAKKLADFCRHFPVKINIIRYNPHTHSDFEPSGKAREEHFIAFLEERHILVYVRQSKGKDISAACGQLVNNGGKC